MQESGMRAVGVGGAPGGHLDQQCGVAANDEDTLRLLRSLGASIEAVVLGDGGPRHQATWQALVKAGANLQLADREGRTSLQLAKARGYAAMVAMLEAAGRR